MQMPSSHPADTEYLVRHAMDTGYMWSSLLAPPAYIAFVVARRGRAHLSLNRVLRATWLAGLSAVTGGAAYVRYANSSEESVRLRRLETAYNMNTLRRNDHSTIGAVLMAVLTPALLWNKARIVNLILGGAGLGSGIGLLTHYGQTMVGDHPPKVDIILPPSPE
ncbi:hypothetical protein B0H34DRAFT_308347 [Crassisporium funariophilum]|nr:hypothetical protein B0H34DRAFT_308347 [Crassisporium funariophilum]